MAARKGITARKDGQPASADRRVRRTQATLQRALIALVEEQDLSLITVADVAERAGVSRSTFYDHRSPKQPSASPRGRRCGQVHHDWHERQRRSAAPGAVATAFGSLRHDEIGAEVHRLSGLLEIGDLHDQHRASPANGFDERARVTEGLHHRPWTVLQRTLDRVEVDRPALKADAPRFVGALGEDRQLALQPVHIPIATAQQAQPSAIRDSRRQNTAGRSTHRRKRNWMLQTKELRERRRQLHNRHHHPSARRSGPRAADADYGWVRGDLVPTSRSAWSIIADGDSRCYELYQSHVTAVGCCQLRGQRVGNDADARRHYYTATAAAKGVATVDVQERLTRHACLD